MEIDTGFWSRVRFWLRGVWRWLRESHRVYHLACGFLVGLVLGVRAAVAVGAAFEVKDCQHSRENAGRGFRDWSWRCFDWADFGLTCFGGVCGGLLNWLLWGVVL